MWFRTVRVTSVAGRISSKLPAIYDPGRCHPTLGSQDPGLDSDSKRTSNGGHMYGHLIQLSGDLTARTTWRGVAPGSAGRANTIDEDRLQDILFKHSETLPLDEIDSAYETPVPVCRELGTGVGFVDALYLTPTGRIILAEFKLWRNPSARREVIGQILDYARVLATWSYDDLEREVRKRVKRSPFEIVSEAHGDMQEHIFIDAVRPPGRPRLRSRPPPAASTARTAVPRGPGGCGS